MAGSMNMSVMKERYQKEVVPALMKRLELKNIMEVPRLEKAVVNIGLGEAIDNPKALDAAVGDMTQITGQKPIVTKARKSVANFKLREGRAIVGIYGSFVEYCPTTRSRFSWRFT
jgi:large subunit ribosomal protein L5